MVRWPPENPYRDATPNYDSIKAGFDEGVEASWKLISPLLYELYDQLHKALYAEERYRSGTAQKSLKDLEPEFYDLLHDGYYYHDLPHDNKQG